MNERSKGASGGVRAALAETGQVPRARVDAGQVPRARVDAGYFTGDLAHAVEQGCDFAIAAKRNTAMWRAYASIEGMPGAQVAPVDYAPTGWPEDTYTIVRRVRIDAEAISADPRSRRRRTIDPGQLALALEGTATHAYAVSFIVTHEDSKKGETISDVEALAPANSGSVHIVTSTSRALLAWMVHMPGSPALRTSSRSRQSSARASPTMIRLGG